MEPLCCHWVDGLWATVLGLSNLAVPSQVGCPLRKGSKEQMAQRQGGRGLEGTLQHREGGCHAIHKGTCQRAAVDTAGICRRGSHNPQTSSNSNSRLSTGLRLLSTLTDLWTGDPGPHLSSCSSWGPPGVGGGGAGETGVQAGFTQAFNKMSRGLWTPPKMPEEVETGYNEQQKTMPRKHKTTPCLYSTGW